ncbi:hypothetical protein EW146_g400 [Bondarzewia mesenterica]|uniref:RING-type domain-containing protein n=1 Tax=Bondarzewia mesenterica TaxID=1095465 RepID=A0A4S4M757_9AGAM|nr:hypothetical protein EW146_g400 [Bondarzewia mesenterica]
MSSVKIHPHPSLPAPVVHASVSLQSKSHVLTGVQDAYWSDEEEVEECPLCLEEMDVSDLNFKPCPCGYQICRFCWHHIKENLNKKCPACRREYSDETVQFKPVNKEDHRRLTQQKKQRERERKDLDALGRRHLANVRVVQRNVVYVVGIGPRFAKEELISTLRSNEYFGQYGRISKILLVKRTPPGGQAPVVGLYITYHRREDAARCIAAVDGTASPGGGNEAMRASFGTTKYCMSFLRGVNCTDHSCMNLHEWGDEKDIFTKEDLTTLQHGIKDTEVTRRTVVLGKRSDDPTARLPRAASWAKDSKSHTTTALQNNTNVAGTSTRPARRVGATRVRAPTPALGADGPDPHALPSKAKELKNSTATSAVPKPSSVTSSRPSTPAGVMRPMTPASAAAMAMKVMKPRPVTVAPPPPPPRSPTSSIAVDSDAGSGSQDLATSNASPELAAPPAPSTPALPPGLPAVPLGLSGPPGLPPPNRSQQGAPSYQMSTQVQALLNDVKARRESAPGAVGISPFPDFDRTLQNLSGGNNGMGGFSFNLDPKLAGTEDMSSMPDLGVAEANTAFHGNFTDAFPALRNTPYSSPNPLAPPPGLSYPHNPSRSIYDPMALRSSPSDRQSSASSSYTGSFNPFADLADGDSAAATARRLALDDDPSRKMSRFGFARGGRQNGANTSSASSPLIASSPLSPSESVNHGSLFSANDLASPTTQWSYPGHHFHSHNASNTSSPLVPQAQAQVQPPLHPVGRFQPFDQNTGVSEAALRELIQSSRDRERAMAARGNAAVLAEQEHRTQYRYNPGQPFNDPAIMSASFASPVPSDVRYSTAVSAMECYSQQHMPYGPPPGLSPSPSQVTMGSNLDLAYNVPNARSPALSPSPLLSSSDFPALTAQPPQPSTTATSEQPPEQAVEEKDSKAAKNDAKKAAAAERAMERAKVAAERKLEKEKERAQKKLERERLVQERLQKEKEERERLEMEKAEKEKARLAREKAEKEIAKLEREKAGEQEKAAKEKAAQAKKASTAAASKPQAIAQKAVKAEQAASPASPRKGSRRASVSKPATPVVPPPEPVSQGPLLSKMPKKNRPITKPIRIPKEEEPLAEMPSALASAATSEAPQLPIGKRGSSVVDTNSASSRGQSVERTLPSEPTSLKELLAQIDMQNPAMNLANHPFFDLQKINPAAKMPLEYGPLVHALSALSVGGGSFANNMPSGSIDNAVSSFQQLLETLTQTISDLLRLLPRTTWDDSSSFDGVLRDMLKGDDFLDEGGEDGNGHGKDEVAALTLALERRARWMEVQLSKLEELHRDINTAAVRAVLSFNDNGWDPHGFAPRMGNTLQKFDLLGMVSEGAVFRKMMVDELEKKLAVAKEATVFAETEVREVMEKMQALKPVELEYY